jgi:hypothetical protein
MIFRCRANTMSGVPGNAFTCKRYRYPKACTKRRTAISGAVSFDLTLDMIQERRALLTESVIAVLDRS